MCVCAKYIFRMCLDALSVMPLVHWGVRVFLTQYFLAKSTRLRLIMSQPAANIGIYKNFFRLLQLISNRLVNPLA